MKKDGSSEGVDDDDMPRHDPPKLTQEQREAKETAPRPAFSSNPTFHGSSSSLNVGAVSNAPTVSWEVKREA